MVATSKNKLPQTVFGTPSRRRTRNSFFEVDLEVPPEVILAVETRKGVTHAAAVFARREIVWWCCRRDVDMDMVTAPGAVVTCLACVLCKGCPACRENHITMKSLEMGKWETKDRRKLYPFEMDNQHLMNAIAKLKRDREHFKRHWVDWLSVMEDEARKRGLQ